MPALARVGDQTKKIAKNLNIFLRKSVDELKHECIKKYPEMENYGFEKSVMYGSKEKIEIVCPIHNSFWIEPTRLLMGQGCSLCGKIKCALSRSITFKQFEIRSNLKHNNSYKYDENTYLNTKSIINIFCKKCQIWFKQKAKDHLYSNGCKKCGYDKVSEKLRKNFTTFQEFSKKMYPERFLYDEHSYKNWSTKTKIFCIKHKNWFEQIPRDHVNNNEGCASCRNCGTSKSELNWLNSLNISNLELQKRIYFNGSDGEYVIVDGYDPSTNTIYEYNGKFFHGHPDEAEPNQIHPYGGTYGDRYKKTLLREIKLVKAGYTVISIWR